MLDNCIFQWQKLNPKNCSTIMINTNQPIQFNHTEKVLFKRTASQTNLTVFLVLSQNMLVSFVLSNEFFHTAIELMSTQTYSSFSSILASFFLFLSIILLIGPKSNFLEFISSAYIFVYSSF